MNDRIIIFDTTLRDGEQAPGASMTLPEKVEIARRLALLGVDVIEAGFPVSSPGQAEAVRRVAAEVEGPVVCALARAVEGDIEAAGRALADGARTRIHTFIPTSDIHIRAKFAEPRFGATLAEKRRTIVRRTREAVAYACTFTDDVEFSAEDAGRTDIAFLCEVVQAAVEAGATTINVPDTTGYCTPDEYAALIAEAVACAEGRDDVVFSVHCHDDLGLAVANSLAGVTAGARQVECTVNGIGERAGNAALEEVVMALQVRADRYGLAHGIDTRRLAETSRIVSVACGFTVPPNKAIVGKNAFSHEAGIHQHGVLKERATYEIMRAEDVGQKPEAIRLGRHSGRAGLFARLERLGFTVPEHRRAAVYERFVDLADRKKEVFEADLFGMMESPMPRVPVRHYRLDHLSVRVGTGEAPEARVRVAHLQTGETREHTATGDGPVDAIYRAVDHAVEEGHDLVDYSIRSVTEGADAQGEVLVLISHDRARFAGRATSTDVLRASADAYVNALNHLAAYRDEHESVKFVTDGIMQAFGGPAA